jgi:hypothetical protein
MSKPYIVFDQRIAGWCMLNGVKLISIRPDKFEPTKNVFIFNNEAKDVKKIIENYREGRNRLEGLLE